MVSELLIWSLYQEKGKKLVKRKIQIAILMAFVGFASWSSATPEADVIDDVDCELEAELIGSPVNLLKYNKDAWTGMAQLTCWYEKVEVLVQSTLAKFETWGSGIGVNSSSVMHISSKKFPLVANPNQATEFTTVHQLSREVRDNLQRAVLELQSLRSQETARIKVELKNSGHLPLSLSTANLILEKQR